MNATEKRDNRYKTFRLRVEKEADIPDFVPYDSYTLVAHCVLKSRIIDILCACDALFIKELEAIRTSTEVPVKLFIDTVRLKEGKKRGQLPRFQFSARLWEARRTDPRLVDIPEVLKVVYSCRFGVASLPIEEIVGELPIPDWNLMVEVFNSDIDLQIRCLSALYYRKWKYFKGGDRDWMSAVGNACGDGDSGLFGEKVAGLAEELRGGPIGVASAQVGT
jgi:hypothetical protein